jgi:2-polyprenyl-3-methyl-5-hydroxy-6-metoxy-1,4-benzoquinol methylase
MQAAPTEEKEFVLCNLCGNDRYSVIAETSRYVMTPDGLCPFHVRLVCCEVCGLIYWNPRKTAEELRKYYANSYRAPVISDNLDEARRRIIQKRIQLLIQYVRNGRLLEIGSGEGFFLQKANEAGFLGMGVEPSVAYAQISRSIAPHLQVDTACFEEFETKERFKVICHFFVLEHTLDASEFLNKCYRLLMRGGWLYLEVPDVALYPYQLSDMVWHEHTYHFIKKTIRKLLMKTGFRIIDIHSPGPSYEFGMAILAKKDQIRILDPKSWIQQDSESVQLAVQYFYSHFERMKKYRYALREELDPLLNRIRTDRAKLAIYGTGIFYDQLYVHTDLKPSDVTLIVDENEEKWGKPTQEGLKIESPKRLIEMDVDTILIASDCFESKMKVDVVRWCDEQGKSYEPFCLHDRAVKRCKDEY